MFDSIVKFFKKFSKEENKESGAAAKERLHLVLMQDRANVSADFMELMKQEIIEVIKKYIDVDENSIDVKLTNKVNSDGTTGAPILYANIPILNVKDDTKQVNIERKSKKNKKEEKEETKKEDKEEIIEEKIENDDKEDKKEDKEEKKEQESLEQKEEANKEKEIVENDEDGKDKKSDEEEKEETEKKETKKN